MTLSGELVPAPPAQVVARRLLRRLVQLYAGLIAFGVSMALLVRARLGAMPWDVLHLGIAHRVGWSMGTVTIAVGALVLLLWIPIRQRPGVGTVSNVVVIGVAVDATLGLVPPPGGSTARAGLLAAGIVLNGIATAAYIGAGFGPGPRDGLMTGLVARTGGSVRLVKVSIDTGVAALGWLLGGPVGAGTLLFALGVGPLTQLFLPALTVGPAPGQPERGRRPGRATRSLRRAE